MSEKLHPVMREAGAALAVLTLYLLTLLTPLHQSAASQRVFADLGYETVGAWSLCTAIGEADARDGVPAILKCPATGIGKFDLFASDTAPALDAPLRIASGIVFSGWADVPARPHPTSDARPRAPPARV